jgi:hypothetical protein
MALYMPSFRSIGFELGREGRPNTAKDLGFRVIFGGFEEKIVNRADKQIFLKIRQSLTKIAINIP